MPASAVPGTIKKHKPTELIPNPLHQFASWTYNWSLWWLDVADYNAMQEGSDVGSAIAYPLGPKSYVVAQDSGLYPNQRLPTQLGLNYNIQTVDFLTVVGHNSTSKTSNMIDGAMTIIEPYGVTFIDSLVEASFMGSPGYNYLEQPYMLQLDFKGYDDAGEPISDAATALYRKRFPIKLTGVKVNVTNKGAEYKINYYALGHKSYRPEHSTTPKNITVVAGTVKEFLKNFAIILNGYWQLEVFNGARQFSDTIDFEFDNNIGISKIVYDKQMSLTQANPKKEKIDLTSGSFNIPAGTQITEVINKVLIQSEYLIDQLGLDFQSADKKQQETSLTKILNTFKITSHAKFSGADSSGTVTDAAFDNVRNTYPTAFTYKIHQYTETISAPHPAAPLLTDSRPYTLKAYNYLYTGKNNDIIDFKINFDTTWYTAVMSYTKQYGASQASASTGLDTKLANSGTILLSPQLLAASGAIPGLDQIPNLTPLRYSPIFNDQRDTMGMNIMNNPAAQVTSNVMRSLYSKPSGDMVAVDLQIVGDPTLIKQDDWLYVPSPIGTSVYNNWDSVSQSAFAGQYGHIRMDTGALIVSLTINTPLDNDTDWTNQGLAFPQPGAYRSLFSGQYKILTIKNTFASGKFEQTLRLVRDINSDLITNAAPDTSANARPNSTNTSQDNQNSNNNNLQPVNNTSIPISTTQTTVQGTPVNAGTFNMPPATEVVVPQYSPPLNSNDGFKART